MMIPNITRSIGKGKGYTWGDIREDRLSVTRIEIHLKLTVKGKINQSGF